MAHLHYDAYRAPGEVSQHVAEPLRVGLMVNVIGAVLSVALVAGVGIWSYRLMVRDVSGVPVVRALEGPMRISPDDPGGRQAAYQGLAVNAVAADGTAGSAPQEIVLAPGPVALSGEDRPVQRAGGEPPLAAAPEMGRAADAEAMVIPASLSLGELDLVAPGTPGVARSPIPPRRPGGAARATTVAGGSGTGGHDATAEALLEQLVTRLAPARFIDIDPDTLAAGTRLVQLGAYDDEAAAREAWETLAGRFSAHLDGRGRIIEPASSGGRTFYRLRAHGFADEPEARRFCAVLLAENADCIPVLIR